MAFSRRPCEPTHSEPNYVTGGESGADMSPSPALSEPPRSPGPAGSG